MTDSNSRKKYSWQERFWSLVDANDPSGCWTWKGGRLTGYGASGRGYFNARGLKKNSLAHRVMYELVVGPIPPNTLDQPQEPEESAQSCEVHCPSRPCSSDHS